LILTDREGRLKAQLSASTDPHKREGILKKIHKISPFWEPAAKV